jgi:predicted NAD/FAD-binding protein
MRIAVIGSGIAGLGAAWALAKRHDVTLYEQEARPGGHANTVDVDYDGRRIAVDTGFIVYNETNYPNLTRLFETLGVATEVSDMSFGVSLDDGRIEWAGDGLGSLFAQKRNLLRPSHHAMWWDILRFNKLAANDMTSGRLDGLTLGEYLAERRFGAAFRERYLVPMGAAIWSTPNLGMLDFPAKTLVSFFENHSLLAGFNTFTWRTVTGGSRSYVAKLLADFSGSLRLNAGVRTIERDNDGVTVTDASGIGERYDQAVLACHPDQALAMLDNATAAETSILGAIPYAPNRAVLHRDASLMPRRTKVWSSWNYVTRADRPDDAPVSLTYWMNRLQNIDRATPLFVTLNPTHQPRPELTFAEFDYAHPQFSAAAQVAQRRLAMIQGTSRVWFCGAWCGYGFHEDGLTAGLEIAERLGAPAPWGAVAAPRLFLRALEAAE